MCVYGGRLRTYEYCLKNLFILLETKTYNIVTILSRTYRVILRNVSQSYNSLIISDFTKIINRLLLARVDFSELISFFLIKVWVYRAICVSKYKTLLWISHLIYFLIKNLYNDYKYESKFYFLDLNF